MIVFFGLSLYVNQLLSGQGKSANANPQQETINKITPVLFSGMFFWFPLPAGVLMYMTIANVFQTAQTFILSREALPEEIQKLVEAEEKAIDIKATVLPFEPGRTKKDADAKPSKKSADPKVKAKEPKPKELKVREAKSKDVKAEVVVEKVASTKPDHAESKAELKSAAVDDSSEMPLAGSEDA